MDHIKTRIENAIKHREKFAVIGTALWEPIDPVRYWLSVQQLQNFCDQQSIPLLLILNTVVDQFQWDTAGINFEYIDFFLLRTWKYCHGISQPVRNTDGPILFLPGKLSKPHRAPLLIKFWQNQTLDHLTYSFYPDSSPDLKQYLHLNENKWQEFLALQRPLNDIRIIKSVDNPNDLDFSTRPLERVQAHHCAFPFDQSLYSNTSCSIVSETNYDDPIWITEKTWRTMLCGHPFVMAGTSGTLNRLQKKNFRTFTNYLPYPHYDTVHDGIERLEQIYQNILALKSSKDPQINVDTDYNYRCCLDLVQDNLTRISEFFARVGIEKSPLDCIPLHDAIVESNQFQKFEELS